MQIPKGNRIITNAVAVVTVLAVILIMGIFGYAIIKFNYNNEILKLKTPVSSRNKILQKYLNDISINANEASKKIIERIENESLTPTYDIQEATFPVLLNILEISNATGAFIIFGDQIDNSDRSSALYIRDIEPNVDQHDHKDILYLRGPSAIAREHNISIDSEWRFDMLMRYHNSDYYTKPLEARIDSITHSPGYYGYWSPEFKLSDTDKSIITYTLPLIGVNGVCYGVFGYEIASDYLKAQMPVAEIPFTNAIYVLNESSNIHNPTLNGCVLSGAYADVIFSNCDNMELSKRNKKDDMLYQITMDNNQRMVGVLSNINIYNTGDYYSNEVWSLIGMVQEVEFNLVGKKALKWYTITSVIISIISILGMSFLKIRRNNNIKLLEEERKKEGNLSSELFDEFIKKTETLTYTERIIFNHYLEGKSSQEVASLINISLNTIKVHNNHIYTKLEISSRDELILYANLIKKSGNLSKLII